MICKIFCILLILVGLRKVKGIVSKNIEIYDIKLRKCMGIEPTWEGTGLPRRI